MHLQLGLLRAAHEHRRPGTLSGLGKVHARCVKGVTALLAQPARGHDDWSIKVPLRCRCELCVILSRFLAAADKNRLEWPLAKEKRAHVHRTIDSRDLPVRHETRRTGSPHTLVLQKTSALFQREAAARRMWQADLDWLTQIAADFRPAESPVTFGRNSRSQSPEYARNARRSASRHSGSGAVQRRSHVHVLRRENAQKP